MTGVAREEQATGAIERVSTLELFFDLVFVLAITQLTELVVEEPDLEHVVRAGLLLAAVFWMYGAFAWLTNAVSADGPVRRAGLLGGMACFLVIALAIPKAFDDGHGIAFGLAYLVVVLLHGALFWRGARGTPGAILSVLPFNVASALLVIGATAVGGGTAVVLLVLSLVPSWIVGGVRATRSGGFDIAADHFVERHGLVVIIAIGESIVEIGRGASGLPLTPELLLTALLVLLLCAALWWTYFGGDDERAVTALAAIPAGRRALVALVAFGHLHVVMLFGIVLASAGVEAVIQHPSHELETSAALFLSGGVALFVAGESLFRRTLQIGRSATRLVVAALLLLAVPIGTQVAALAALVAIVALLGALFWSESRAVAA